jgi:hypothetical protein
MSDTGEATTDIRLLSPSLMLMLLRVRHLVKPCHDAVELTLLEIDRKIGSLDSHLFIIHPGLEHLSSLRL